MEISLPFFVMIGFSAYFIALIIILLLRQGSPFAGALPILGLMVTNILLGLQESSSAIYASLALCASALTKTQNPMLRKLAWASISLFVLALALHLVPGFNNTKLFGPERLPGSDLPYQLYANMDKALAALILIYLFRHIHGRAIDYAVNRVEQKLMFIGIGAILITAYLLGVNLTIKFGELSFAFIFLNLFVTCIAEESFFRYLIQDKLAQISPDSLKKRLPPVLTACIFTLAHFHTTEGAELRLFLIFLAGLLYAFVYAIRRSIVASILTHFSLNFLHFTFFAYPASFH